MATGGGGYPRWGRQTTPKKADLPFAARAADAPQPPAELSAEEAEIFRSFTDRMPADYFAPITMPLLVSLCRHIRNSRMFARQRQNLEEQLSHAPDEKLMRLMMSLSRAQALESNVIAMLCSRLKLTHSTSLRHSRRSFLAEQRPWDVPDDGDGDGLQ
jgi:hypothetical protein